MVQDNQGRRTWRGRVGGGDDEFWGGLMASGAAPLVLAILCEGESSGYPILRRLRDCSEGRFEWADGVAYPLFQRLWRLGYVRAEWKRTCAEGRNRRYYAITDHGRAALAEARTHEFSHSTSCERRMLQRLTRPCVLALPWPGVFPEPLRFAGVTR